MHRWSPELYETFAGPRFQPIVDLTARIPLQAATSVVDLGCGTGIAYKLLAERFGADGYVGLDMSPDMLAKARDTHPDACFQQGDIGDWSPEAPIDLLFSNATLQWLPDHTALIPRLFGYLGPGGVLAVQVPAQHEAPSFAAMTEVAWNGPWAERLSHLPRPTSVRTPAAYWRLLAPSAARVDIWTTTYLQVLTGDDPVAAFTRSTALAPFLEALEDEAERDAFFTAYQARLRRDYPAESDGSTLYPFKRLFIVAQAPAA